MCQENLQLANWYFISMLIESNQDLVPCVLLSFERECILMWKGPKTQLESSNNDGEDTSGETTSPYEAVLPEDTQELLNETLLTKDIQAWDSDGEEFSSQENEEGNSNKDFSYESDVEEIINEVDEEREISNYEDFEEEEELGSQLPYSGDTTTAGTIEVLSSSKAEVESEDIVEDFQIVEDSSELEIEVAEEAARDLDFLWQQAIDSGEAVMLDEPEPDPDIVFEKVKAIFGTVQGTPARARMRYSEDDKSQEGRKDDGSLKKVPTDSSGLLRIDELAKLLAP